MGGEDEPKTYAVHAIGDDEINDTNGAGLVFHGKKKMMMKKWLLTEANICLVCNRDAFAGGFVAGMLQGQSLDTCVDMGHWLAKLSIRELGPS